MKGRIQHSKYLAAELETANPLLLDGEIVYESDTGRSKIGDGITRYDRLPYTTDAEAIPALSWKVQDGMLCVKPATDLMNPILERCSVGILHYKNARKRYQEDQTGRRQKRPKNSGFKLVQDTFARGELAWTAVRINPVPFDLTADRHTGWMPVISVRNLFERWVTTIPDPKYSGGGNSSFTAAIT